MTGGTPPVRSPLERGVPGGTAPGLHLPPAISNPYLLILTPTLTHPQYPAPISTMVLQDPESSPLHSFTIFCFSSPEDIFSSR